MVLELALLQICPGKFENFEAAYSKAIDFVSSAPGFLSSEIRRCAEDDHRVLILSEWETIEDHTVRLPTMPGLKEVNASLESLIVDGIASGHFFAPFARIE